MVNYFVHSCRPIYGGHFAQEIFARLSWEIQNWRGSFPLIRRNYNVEYVLFSVSTTLLLRMSSIGRSYLQTFLKFQYIIIQAILSRKSMKKVTVTDEKPFVFTRLLTIKHTSGTNLGTSHTQLSDRSCQYREEDSKIKLFPKKRTLPAKMSR